MSRSIVLYMHVHQPWRVQPYSVFDTGENHVYFDSHDAASRTNNESIFHKVADKSYWPMTRVLQEMLESEPGFHCSLSITGTFLEQCQRWEPELLQQFQRIVATGRVEIIAETYHHSLAFFYSRFEFEKQVLMHRELIEKLFGVKPRVFRGTELSYNDELAAWAESAGYAGVLAEGWDPVLAGRTPNALYQPAGTERVKLLLKNYRLSDDVAFRFSQRSWVEWPLTADKYLSWLEAVNGTDPVVGLFMDFETFGEHQWSETGIFDFIRTFVGEWCARGYEFQTPSQAIAAHEAVDNLSVPETITWADNERDLSAWRGNRMQHEALRYVYDLENAVLRSGDEQLMYDWRQLQTSDHFYYMCTKWFNDGDVHAYFSPYESPYDAFLYYLNVIRDLRWRISEHQKGVL